MAAPGELGVWRGVSYCICDGSQKEVFERFGNQGGSGKGNGGVPMP